MTLDGSSQVDIRYLPVPSVRGGIVCRPELVERLATAARVSQISAPAGSGKTFLLRSWMYESGLVDSAAWVTVPGGGQDQQQFWISILDALRDTIPGSKLVRPLTGVPRLDGWAVVERLLKDLEPLEDPLWLVIDDLHELVSAEAQSQLELLVMRAPMDLRFLLATRKDARLGLHRLRLEGKLTEIRRADLQFNLDEARALFSAAGVELPSAAVAALVQRTEGWAAGLRLAALSLAGHPAPERFVAEFSGTERTVAEYLLAEVLDQQSEPVRRLLLRTSVCERVSGELADLLTQQPGGERILQDLEDAGAFVVSLDARRSCFRYHQMFADLLQLELRRAEPAELATLHRTAAGWFAAHDYPVEAVRHAQAAQDWSLAACLFRRSLEAAERYLARAEQEMMSVLPDRLAGNKPAPPRGEPDRLPEPLSRSEARVLRFLPTNLSAPEIASQLSVSVNTVRTHMRHVYEKLGAHSRTEAVERARKLGLLGPSSRKPITAFALQSTPDAGEREQAQDSEQYRECKHGGGIPREPGS